RAARGCAGRDVGGPFCRARAVAYALLHRLAGRAVDARSGHRGLRGALARVTTRWGAPKWPPTPPALVAPRQSRGAPRSPDSGLNHTASSVREVASPKRPIEYPGSPV